MSTTNIKINSLRTEYDFLRPCTDTSLISLDNSTLSSQFNNQTSLEGVLDYLSRIYAHWWKREIRTPIYGEKLEPIQSSQYESTPIKIEENVDVSETKSFVWQGSNTIKIDSNTGEISLDSPISYTVEYGFSGSGVEGEREKYVKFDNKFYTADECTSSIITRIKGNSAHSATVNYCVYSYKHSGYYPSIKEISSQQVSYTSTWDYIFSFERNAYPDSRTIGQYTYTYLGIPFENARGGLT